MIEMYEGVPGSGKTYHAVSAKLLLWVRAGRRIYAFVDGFYLDRLALFEGIAQEDLSKQVTLWYTSEEVKAGILTVEPGSAVLLDEVQTIFRSKDKTDPDILRWLETHRHRGIDIVMMCQQYGQVTLGVNRLVESTTKFRRLDRFGFKNRYQAFVRGNPEETEVIRAFTGRYEPKYYSYYSSYSQAAVRESARGGSILKSPTVIVGIIGLVVAVGWFSFGGWLTGGAVAQAQAVKASSVKLAPPPPLPTVASTSVVVPSASPEVKPVRIQGGMSSVQGNQRVWLWVSEDGRFYTEEEIVVESGGTVVSRVVRGVRVLTGTGVVYGGSKRDETVPDRLSYQPEVNPNHQAVVVPPPGPFDLGATPHGILATPKGF